MSAAKPVIGGWVRRERLLLWHRVESIVAGDAITTCGRRMADQPTTDGGLATTDDPGDEYRCSRCA